MAKTKCYRIVIRRLGTKQGKGVGLHYKTPSLARIAAYELLYDEPPFTIITVYRAHAYGQDQYWFVAKDREGIFDIGRTRESGCDRLEKCYEHLRESINGAESK